MANLLPRDLIPTENLTPPEEINSPETRIGIREKGKTDLSAETEIKTAILNRPPGVPVNLPPRDLIPTENLTPPEEKNSPETQIGIRGKGKVDLSAETEIKTAVQNRRSAIPANLPPRDLIPIKNQGREAIARDPFIDLLNRTNQTNIQKVNRYGYRN